MNVNIDVEPGAEDVFTEKFMLARFLDRAFEDFRAFWEFASYIYVRGPGVEREAGDRDSFEQLMRIFVDDVAVFERARLGFICVADQIDWLFLIGLDEAPLDAAGKAGASATTQPGVFDFIDNLGARHRQGLLQLFVTAVAQITVDVCRPIFAPDVFKNQAMFERMRRSQLRIADCGLRI